MSNYSTKGTPLYAQIDFLERKNAELEAENARLETERDNWIETAREYANNADFFRSLVVKCGVAIGAESYIQDDGGISEDVLCIKVPTLVEKLIAENARLRDAVLNAYHTGHDHTVEGGFQWCAVGSQEVADEIIAEALNPTKPTSAVIERLQAKNVGLESALADIREVYAGSEGIPVAETCAEAYVIRLIEQMYSIAVEALTPTSAGDE